MQPADDARMRDITARIVAALAPERILLFGSYALGSPHAQSDLDLYVVVPDQAEPPYRRARRAYHALHGVQAPVDLVVRTRAESARNARVASTLDCGVLTHGIVLYGR
ncbi:nucleotidyltransferase domain-containing protein [uncultured Thiodictyon sp.]|jgi:predicted nucleotidyltransferase|uniref:nucleotidyltransferase domain-containing protein n=1 Tax=uncultured Thiodictyon sp. TaxID=1846217 RepID=UPI0025E1122C|nr:nucleotidyltransferase domain-containing protein [uncultured Thiodictyon sp.]